MTRIIFSKLELWWGQSYSYWLIAFEFSSIGQPYNSILIHAEFDHRNGLIPIYLAWIGWKNLFLTIVSASLLPVNFWKMKNKKFRICFHIFYKLIQDVGILRTEDFCKWEVLELTKVFAWKIFWSYSTLGTWASFFFLFLLTLVPRVVIWSIQEWVKRINTFFRQKWCL